MVDDYTELCGITTGFLYACPNMEVTHQLVRVNIATPTPMRAPGENPGLFALESAMDELSYLVGIDPVELRLLNYAETDAEKNLPFSSKHLRECYETGRDRIGWKSRSPHPRTTPDGRHLIGYGMATSTYPGYRSPGAALVRLYEDGTVEVASATQDIGTGTYTTMAQVAGTAPCRRTSASTARAVSAFRGQGMPCEMMVDSRATTGRPAARAAATSVCRSTLAYRQRPFPVVP